MSSLAGKTAFLTGGSRGITINTVQPGPTETEMNGDPAQRAMLRTLMAVGRLGQDTEIASLVAYLAGPESGFITGAAHHRRRLSRLKRKVMLACARP